MHVLDTHCDVLSKLFQNPELDFRKEASLLDVTVERLLAGKVKVQNFAIYLSERWNGDFKHVLDCVDLFLSRIVSEEPIHFVRTKQDLQHVLSGTQIGAMLSLEGVDALGGNLAYLRILYELGLRSVGLTWNYANWAADGVLEARKGGLTAKGRQLIAECNRLGLVLDVSHLSEAGFWELAELSERPFIASHSNAGAISPCLRNLNDGQIAALIRKGGVIGITFVPPFVMPEEPVTMDKLLLHIDHICSLGGKRHIGFGSDFDGTSRWLIGLEHAGKYPDLADMLLNYYSADDVEHFLSKNWIRYFMNELPEQQTL
ncbi:dipeptidase [Paenibacillus sp. DMB20]|uniref:dipeptidase n=1 Tax=Paenibacillus sp. DMB20 TaxID=1642570 RepID=UPI000699DE12|nr:dipeptidase [Paenibacillus sp. DMB20]